MKKIWTKVQEFGAANYKKMIVAIIGVFVLSMSVSGIPKFSPQTAQAAVSSATKRKAQKAYRDFLDGSDYLYFRVYDVDKDGLKELLVSYDGANSNGKYVYDCTVYTYYKGRIKNCGRIYSMNTIQYNTNSKRLHGARGGGGSIEYWHYTLTKSKNVKSYYLQAIENGMKNGYMTYRFYYKGKKISGNTFNSKARLWNRQCRPLQFYRISEYAISNYVRL